MIYFSSSQLRTVVIVFSMLAFTGCATTTKVETVGAQRLALENTCKVEILEKSALPPSAITIGKLETHIKGNIFFGGVVRTNDEGYKELRTKVCALGGNAVVVDDLIESSAAEMRHIHIWARALLIPKAQ
ncbi:hypothetical protein ACO0LG_22070 [Undibacterium sp. Ji42W]|uniref:hypothetical protein n=1 Tax=Undibacterium sp. Ji42W TaxID=3413039 RepID=UPI003BF18EBC